MKTIMTVNEVAELLQMSKSSVYKYAETGKIESLKIGTIYDLQKLKQKASYLKTQKYQNPQKNKPNNYAFKKW